MADTQDFHWVQSDEPHKTRRAEILQKHPEIRELFGHDSKTFWVVLFIFCLQLSIAYYMRNQSWGFLLLIAYIVGGTVNHTLQLAVHDISHNLCWATQNANYITGIFANLVTGFPSSVTFRRYHMEHHSFQGVDGVDTDIPTMGEVNFFTNAFLKVIWCILQPAFYSMRPLWVKPKHLVPWEMVNAVVQFSFDIAIYMYFGPKSLAYLCIGTLLGLGLHPTAGHFIAEHYEFTKGIETYSYYGPINFFNLNVGYHNEHHDFPRVPWTRLPEVRKMAPEFYDTLPSYTSYLYVFYKYIFDPTIGPHSRVKRPNKYYTPNSKDE